jgi:hypothetical protein
MRIKPCTLLAAAWPQGWDLDDPHWKARKYDPFLAYGASKMANVLMAKALASR